MTASGVDPKRSRLMGRVRQAHTAPEVRVRRALHRIGYRFRLHRRDLPGRPDIVLPRHKLVVFVHGCFWHRHAGCSKATTPKSRVEFWSAKFEANLARDQRQQAQLLNLGWRVVVIWECETKDLQKLVELLNERLR